MTRFPDRLQDRLAHTIADTRRLVTNAHQRLNTVTSAVYALQPGDWALLQLAGGWSHLTDYIPAQSRIQQTGTAWLCGHITGGATTTGTVIGQMAQGHYNPVYQHSFTANVITGAGAVPVTGTVAGSSDSGTLANGTITGYSDTGGLPNGTITGYTGYGAGGSTTATHYHAGSASNGNLSVTNGQHYHGGSYSGGSMAVTNSAHQHGATGLTPSVPVNYNTPLVTVTASGQLILSNCPAGATQISFSEYLPLVTG